ncbi:hypothetical protein PTI98_004436 [Pleurotus ostreatus]|nr:hypothetical protein PTI98_004436 [Pleurotus ostreatus]
MSSPANTHFMAHSLTLVQQSSYIQIAGAVILIYDHTLTVHDECELVWGAPWSIGKVLFLLNRYPPFVDASMGVYRSIAPSITADVCAYIYHVSGWMIIAGIIMSEVIIVIRVWALWQFSRIVGASLLIVAILGISITSISYVKFSDEMTFVDMNNIAPNLDGCFSAPRSNIVFLAFVGLVVWETLVVILLLSRGARHFGHVSNGFLLRMYQNGIMYYIFMAFVSCINIDILLTGRPESANLLTPYALYPPITLSVLV